MSEDHKQSQQDLVNQLVVAQTDHEIALIDKKLQVLKRLGQS